MKKIFVPLTIHTCPLNITLPLHGAEETYLKKLVKYDLLPILISPSFPNQAIEELYQTCEGAFYMGGEDIDPMLYGKEKHPETHVGEPERDSIEIPYLKKILADKKPYLGVCRGGQALAVANGGALLQHVPDICTDEKHGPGCNAPYDYLLDAPKHPVIIDKESKAYKILGTEEVMVNSYHHQMVENPGPNMKIVGKSPAGVNEIIEHTDSNYFCFGVQSHPEVEADSFYEGLFAAFAEAVHKT